MVRWLRWHCPPDTGFEIRALADWGRARYLSVTEALHNTDFHTWMEKKHFCFFQTAETGNRTTNSGVKGSGANHYSRAPPGTQRGTRRPTPIYHREASLSWSLYLFGYSSIKTTLGRWYCGNSLKKWLVVLLRPHVHRGLSIMFIVKRCHCIPVWFWSI